MAESDWIDAGGSASTSSIKRAVSAAYPKPAGGGSFARGFNSITAAAGTVAQYKVEVGFAPAPKGGEISAAIQRGLSGGKTGFAPFIFISLSGTTVSDNAYMLGLGDGDPSHFILRKGDLASGLPDVPAGQQGVLRQSTDSYADQTYYHVRLEAIWNPNGDVVLNCYRSIVAVNVPPVWLPIPGMTQFIDDSAGLASGTVPLVGGYTGYGFRSAAVIRRAFFDQIRARAQN